MAVEYDATAKNAMLDHLGTLVTRLAAHTGDPGGANGSANEVSGGTPAYARKAIAWNAAASGSMDDSTNGVDFDIPGGGTTPSWISGWNTAGTVRYFKKLLPNPETFANQGVLRITDADLDLNNDPA